MKKSVLIGYRTEIKDFRDDFIERQFYDFFILKTTGIDDKTLYFQKEEVQAVKFVDLSTAQKMIPDHEIVERPEVYQVLANYLDFKSCCTFIMKAREESALTFYN